MQKNVAGQQFVVFALDTTTNQPRTNDGANLVVFISKDGGTPAPITNQTATELNPAVAKGYYQFDATQEESNANTILVTAVSTTLGVEVLGAPATIVTVPPGFSDTSIADAVRDLILLTLTPDVSVIDAHGAQVTELSLQDVLSLLLINAIGKRAGVGTRTSTASLTGLASYATSAERTGLTDIAVVSTVPGT